MKFILELAASNSLLTIFLDVSGRRLSILLAAVLITDLLAPSYLRELCCSTVTIQRHISLRSSAQADLLVHRTRTVIRQRRAFSVAGPTAWNGLPVALRLRGARGPLCSIPLWL